MRTVSSAANHLALWGGLAPLVLSTAMALHLVTVPDVGNHATMPVLSAVTTQ
jgi:hypothetical protein